MGLSMKDNSETICNVQFERFKDVETTVINGLLTVLLNFPLSHEQQQSITSYFKKRVDNGPTNTMIR